MFHPDHSRESHDSSAHNRCDTQMQMVLPHYRRFLSTALVTVLLSLPQSGCLQSASSTTDIPESATTETEPAAETGKSDLDRPVDELFAEVCGHKIKTFACAECRYEVGVVKATEALFAGGLMRTETATRQPSKNPLALTGEIRFDDRRITHVTLPSEGVVRTVHAVLGDRVRAGQPLVEIESVEIGQAQSAYLEAQAQVEVIRREHDRNTELRKRGFLSEREYLESRQNLETAEIRVQTSFGTLTRLGMTADDIKTLSQSDVHGRVTLRAPGDGLVLSLHAVSGELAKREEPLATIGDNSTVWVWADLYERDIARVTPHLASGALTASVTVAAYPNERFPGTVNLISPSMSEASRTTGVRILVPNPDGRLLAGMFATATLFLPADQNALSVPAVAVLEDEGRAFVFVHHHDDYYIRRPVAVGRTWDDRVEVTGGLAGGETVVADGSFLLKSDVLRSKMGAGCAD